MTSTLPSEDQPMEIPAQGIIPVDHQPDVMMPVPKMPPSSVQMIHAYMLTEPLPPNIASLCGMRQCQICKCDIRALESAGAHYFGQPHRKNLINYMLNRGLAMPKFKLPVGMEGSKPAASGYCDLCSVELNCEEIAKSHYQGKRHLKNLSLSQGAIQVPKSGKPERKKRKLEEGIQNVEMTDADQAPIETTGNGNVNKNVFYCMPCLSHFSSEFDYSQHQMSQEHRQKCASFETPNPAPPAAMKNKFECTACGVIVQSESCFNLHMGGKAHAKMIAKKQAPVEVSPYKCNLCSVTCTDETTFGLHLRGKKHMARMKTVEALA